MSTKTAPADLATWTQSRLNGRMSTLVERCQTMAAAAWRAAMPTSAPTVVQSFTDLQPGDVVAYVEDAAWWWTREVEAGGWDYLLARGDTKFARVEKVGEKSLTVTTMNRPGSWWRYDPASPASMYDDPETALATDRWGRKAGRRMVRVGRYEDVTAAATAAPAYRKFAAALAEADAVHAETERRREAANDTHKKAAAPLKAASARLNAALGFKAVQVANEWAHGLDPEPPALVLCKTAPEVRVLREVLAGAGALGRLTPETVEATTALLDLVTGRSTY